MKHVTMLGVDQLGTHAVYWWQCPNCQRFILVHVHGTQHYNSDRTPAGFTENYSQLVFPFGGLQRGEPPVEVPESLRKDYREAAMILPLSPNASAALSRRCLQATIHAQGINTGYLNTEIDEVINQRLLPSDVADQLDYVRQIGNFSVHPTKSTSTGDIIDVEPGEAEWNLDVLDLLFDYWFVAPAKAKGKKAAFNKKMTAAGKKPLP